MRLFHKPEDYAAFERVLAEALDRYPVELLTYCVMPNHWHLVVRPGTNEALGRWLGWVGVTHVRRHHEHYRRRGGGHLYQGRFKSFPVQDDAHYLTVMRYIEANPLRAGLVKRAGDWPWASLAVRKGMEAPFELSDGPLKLPSRWEAMVNRIERPERLGELENSIKRGAPFGELNWRIKTASRMNLESTLRPRGRPKKCTT